MVTKNLLIVITVASLLMAACGTTSSEGVVSSDGQSGGTAGNDSTSGASGGPSGAEPGAASGDQGQAPLSSQSSDTGNWTVFSNETYKFTVKHPSDYTVRDQPASTLSQFDPKAAAGWAVLSPEKAASDIVDQEPPDLEIRVFDAKGVTSLNDWLSTVGLLKGNTSKPFKTDTINGIQLCASTMIFPDCFYYVLGQDRVYKLTPASQVGEDMVQTFVVTK